MLSNILVSLILATSSLCDASTFVSTIGDNVVLAGGAKSFNFKSVVKRATPTSTTANVTITAVNGTVAKVATASGAVSNAALPNVEQKNLHKDLLGRPLIRGGLLGGIGGGIGGKQD